MVSLSKNPRRFIVRGIWPVIFWLHFLVFFYQISISHIIVSRSVNNEAALVELFAWHFTDKKIIICRYHSVITYMNKWPHALKRNILFYTQFMICEAKRKQNLSQLGSLKSTNNMVCIGFSILVALPIKANFSHDSLFKKTIIFNNNLGYCQIWTLKKAQSSWRWKRSNSKIRNERCYRLGLWWV